MELHHNWAVCNRKNWSRLKEKIWRSVLYIFFYIQCGPDFFISSPTLCNNNWTFIYLKTIACQSLMARSVMSRWFVSYLKVTNCAAFLDCLMYDYGICFFNRLHKGLISSGAMQIDDTNYQQLPWLIAS